MKLRKGSLETRLSRFLFKYRITPHTVTGVAPAEVMFGRRLRTHLDSLKPNLSKKVNHGKEHQKHWYSLRVNQREFRVGDLVYARNYATGPKWLPGRIVESSGNVLFTVVLMDGHQVRKHTDQLIRRYVDSTGQTDGEQLDYDDTSVSPTGDPTNTAPTVDIPPDTPEFPVDTNTAPTVDIPPDTPEFPVDTNTAPTVDIPPDTPELPVDTNTTSRPASRTPSRPITPDHASESSNQDEEQSRDSAPPVVSTRSSRTRNPPNRYGDFAY